MKKKLLLSCCIALLAVGCNCIDCGDTGISVTPPTLLLSYDWDKEFPNDYISEEASATLISSYNWTLSTYDQSRIQLSQIGLNGFGGAFPFKVSYTGAFMQLIQEELIPAMQSGTPLEKFPYNVEIGGYKMTTMTFTSNDGQTASLSVYYPADDPSQPFTLWQGDDITLTDEDHRHPDQIEFEIDFGLGFESVGAPNFNNGNGSKPADRYYLAFETTLAARIDPEITIGAMNFALNNSIKNNLLAHLGEVWEAYNEQRQYGDQYIDTDFFNTYSTKSAYTSTATTLLEQSSLLELDIERDQDQAKFFFTFDRDLKLAYPTIDARSRNFPDDYYASCPQVSIIDIIRNIITNSNATIGTYTLSLSDEEVTLLQKAYDVKIKGKLWVTRQEEIDAPAVTEITLTANNLHLYLNNSFDGNISLGAVPFDFNINQDAYTFDPEGGTPNACGGWEYTFGEHWVHNMSTAERYGFRLELNTNPDRYLVGGRTYRWCYAPQLLWKHKIDLSMSSLNRLLTEFGSKISWDASGKGLHIGKIHYKDITGATCVVEVYLGMSPIELMVLLNITESETESDSESM